MFTITYDLVDGAPIDSNLLRDYAAIHLLTYTFLATEDTVGYHKGKVFAFDLSPADVEPIAGVISDRIFEEVNVIDNRLKTPKELFQSPSKEHKTEPTNL